MVTDQDMRVVFWGTYDLGKPRTRILRDGLRKIGVEVVEIHADVWSQHSDKSQLGKWAMFASLLRVLISYPALIYRYLRAPHHQLVIVPYMGQFDILMLWAFAKLKRKPIVWDMFLSLYDTVVNDRQMASRSSPRALLLRCVEWLGCRAATRVLLDTKAHAAHISRLFSLADGRADAVLVGAEPDTFQRQPLPKPHDGPTRVLFYGQLIPLHGIETILKAAMSTRGRTHEWRIVGTGQHRPLVADAVAQDDSTHVQWDEWVPYPELQAAIAEADICLGIFGPSEKAASVVPNKVYQCLTVGRSVITRLSPAMKEVFPAADPGLRLVDHSDPDALLDAIAALKAEGYPVMKSEQLDVAQPQDIARQLFDDVLKPLVERHPIRVS